MKRTPLEIREIKDDETITHDVFIQKPLETGMVEENLKKKVNMFLNVSMFAGIIFTILGAFTAHKYVFKETIIEKNETPVLITPKIVPFDSSLEGSPDNQPIFQKTYPDIRESQPQIEVKMNSNVELDELKKTFFKEILETKKIADNAVEENKNK